MISVLNSKYKQKKIFRTGVRKILISIKFFRLLVDLSELDIVLSPLGKSLVSLGDLVEESLSLSGVALASGDDGLQVGHLRIATVSGGLSLVKLVGKDVSEDSVVAAALSVLKILDSLVVVTGEDVDDTLVGLGHIVAGLLEVAGGVLEVTVAKGEDTESVVKVSVLGLDIGESLGGVLEVAGVQISGTEVEPGGVAVVLADSLVVELDLAVKILDEGSGVQESGLIENIAVVVDHLKKLIGGVVLELDVGDEAGATKLREDVVLELRIDRRHVLDLALTNGGIAVHGKNAEDEILVADVRILDKLLEAFPVLTNAPDLRIGDTLTLDDLIPSLVSGLGTVVGELAVELLTTVRGSVSDDLGSDKSLALVSGDLVESVLEVLDGLTLELLALYIGGVDPIKDLALSGLLEDGLIAVSLKRNETTSLHKLVGGVDTVSNLLGRKGDGFALILGDTTKLEMRLLHSFDEREVKFLGHSATSLGNNFVVVLDLLALIHEGIHLALTTIVNDDRGDLEDSLRMEVVGRIGHGDCGINVTCDGLKNGGVASDNHIVGQLSHLLG